MTGLEFLKIISELVTEDETLGCLGFRYKGEKYQIQSQWFSVVGGDTERQHINLWASKINDKESNKVYPFHTAELSKLKFFRLDGQKIKNKRRTTCLTSEKKKKQT